MSDTSIMIRREVFAPARISGEVPAARLVSCKSGLWFEWQASLRARVNETTPVTLADADAWRLVQQLQHSTWRPPGVRAPVQNETIFLADLQRAWFRALRNFYGQDALNITQRIFGRRATLLNISEVRGNYQVLSARLAEASDLASLLAAMPHLWRGLDNWQVVVHYLENNGLAPGVWRWLSHQSKASLSRMDLHSHHHIPWLHLWCWLGEDIPSSLFDRATGAIDGFGSMTAWVRRFVADCGAEVLSTLSHQTPRAKVSPRVRAWFYIARVLRLAIEQWRLCRDQAQRDELVSDQFPLVADWLLGQVACGVRVPRSWAWRDVQKAQQAWHHQMTDTSRHKNLPSLRWHSALDRIVLSFDIYATALDSSRALVEEAKRMHHCVPSYVDRCVAGEVRLFHLRSNTGAAERATLEIRLGAFGWQVAQLKGPCNSAVSERMWLAANELTARYTMSENLI